MLGPVTHPSKGLNLDIKQRVINLVKWLSCVFMYVFIFRSWEAVGKTSTCDTRTNSGC